MEIGTIVYLTEPCKWRKTPNGDWDEYEYPVGTPLRVIGDSGMRGPDLEFVENGIQMHECRFVKYSTKKPKVYKIIITETNVITLESKQTTYDISGLEELDNFWKARQSDSFSGVTSKWNTKRNCFMRSSFEDNIATSILQIEL